MEKMAASGVPEHHHHHHHHHSMQSQEGITSSGSVSSNSSSSQTPLIGLPLAPPRTPPDQASIQSSMDKNKESLKRKLMLRRSVNELVDRGIYPPLKTPPAFAEKTKQLERAKTGDLLRHKIQQRPDRQLLVQQHILEDTTIDPSLHERQRLLKRSRLLDGLNGKLAHRPGPLELVQGNILQPSHELADAIKDGTIQFLPTCDTEDMDHSSSSFLFDDESTGSDGAPSPSMDESSDVSSPSSTTPVPSSESLPISFTLTKSISVPLTINKGHQIPFVSANSAIITASGSTSKLNSNQPGTSIGTSVFTSSCSNSFSNSSGKSRSKKPKPKTMSKARIIKFHEYKGPPSVVKNQSSNVTAAAAVAAALGSSCTDDTSYHLLLQQQQLFLQWQLEFQQKQQHGTATVSSMSENATSPTLNSVIVTSPVVTTAPTTQIQPVVPGGTGLVQAAVALQQPQTPSNPVVAQGAFSLVSIPSSSQTSTLQANPAPPPPPPPPPPLPPTTRPTQSVAPRQSAKALTAIPASALCLPKLTANLEEMKVADLKAELKKRSLPVSGPKPQLIERLKPFTESSSSNSPVPSAVTPKTPNSRPPSCTSAPLQFSQTTFHIKTEPNGDTTASPVTRPIPTAASLLTSSAPTRVSNHGSTFSMPITLPFSMQGIKTVVSVKPMVKEEPMTTTDISPANSPPTLQASTPVPTTPMSPEYEATSPPSLTPKLTLPSHPIVQNLGKSPNIGNNHLIQNGSPTTNSVAHGQTVVSMNADIAHSASVVPAEMMPMEIDSVSIDLNQGVDDTAFKAASMGHSLDPANFKALVQHPINTTGFKTVSLSPNSLDNNSIKTVSIDTNIMDANTIKTINLSPNFDASATIKTINISPNTDPATIKAINLGNSADGMAMKTLSLSPGADGIKTISLNSVKDAASLLKTVKVPLSQLSPTHISPVQLTAPLTHALSSPASLLQLQQLQTLQQLQQQLLQQTQLSQHQFHQHALSSQTTAVQLTANDQVVLAQAKQIEELQRQLQESHLKLKLQQLQQQHMQMQQQQQHQQQHQQQQQQQQQQLWHVQIPANFTQNSLLTKLSQDQLTITPQNGQVVTSPLQLQQQQQQSTQVMLQSAASVVQRQPTSVFLNAHTNQQAPQVVSGVQRAHIRPQQHQQHQQQHQQHQQQPGQVMVTNQNIGSSGASIADTVVSIANAVTSDSGLINMTGLTSGQMTSVTAGQATVSLPYAIHINLTSSGQVKLPPHLQTVTTSAAAAAAAATTTKSSALAPLQLPAQLLLTPSSNSILTTQQIKSEPCTPKAMGPPSTTSVPKSQINSGHSYVFTATPSSTLLIPGHTNGVISRTMSLPSSSAITEQQKLNVQCSSPNPYFSGPLKEPPRYDEAIKIKQQQIIPSVSTAGSNSKTHASSDGCLNKPLTLGRIDTGVKSQTMDDVLEILIRNGDLPPSAATEALPVGKLAQDMDSPPTSLNIAITTSAPCLSVTPSVSASLVTAQSHSMPSSPAVPTITSSVRSMNNNAHQNHYHYQISNSTSGPRDQTLTSVHTNLYSDSLMGDIHSSSPNQHDTSGSSSLMLNDGTSHSDEGELLDWGEMLPSPDLCNMDWSSESGFGHLDLGDSSLHLDSKMCDSHQATGVHQSSCDNRFGNNLVQDSLCTSNGPGSHCQNDCLNHKNNSGFCTLTVHGSEPDLAAFNLVGDSSEAIDPASQMDMSEWLDVIMPNPSINLECMNTPTSAPYTSDPILTPRTQQDVFDIFNFDDSDFGPSFMSWDKVTEQGTSS